MAGGFKRMIVDPADITQIARVVNGVLQTSGGGGGGGGDVNLVQIGGIAIPNPPAIPIEDGGGSITVDGTVAVSNFPATQPISGSVSVLNFPAVQPVDDNGGSLTVDGTVAVSNFPATQPISGSVSVLNFPASQTVDDGGLSLTVDGTVGVSNFPAVYPVNDNGGSLTVDAPAATPLAISRNNSPNTQTNPIAISRNNSQNTSGNPIYVSGVLLGSIYDTQPYNYAFDRGIAGMSVMDSTGTNYGGSDGEWRPSLVDFNLHTWVRIHPDNPVPIAMPTKTKFSASTSGKNIAVAAIASPGTLIHTTAGSNQIWLYATNTSALEETIVVQFGGTTAADDIIVKIPAGDTRVVVSGQILDNGQTVRAYGNVASALNVSGYYFQN